jgi:hypothetical protein
MDALDAAWQRLGRALQYDLKEQGLEPGRRPPWYSGDPEVREAWAALTDPSHLELLKAHLRQELDPHARELAIQALAACQERAASTPGRAGGGALVGWSLAWASFCAIASLAVVSITFVTGMNGFGLLHAYPPVVLAIVAAIWGGFVVVPILLIWAAVAMARGPLSRRRFSRVILPLNLVSLAVPLLAVLLADGLARG